MFKSKRNLIILIVFYVVAITLLACFKLNIKIDNARYPYVDKSVHFVFFFGLNFLLLNLFRLIQWFTNYGRYVYITLLTIFYGILIEVVQHFTGRQFDVNDIAYNVFGALVALGVFFLIIRRKEERLLAPERVMSNQ